MYDLHGDETTIEAIQFPGGNTVRIHYYNKEVYKEIWYDENREIHRTNGLPAITAIDGYESYYLHGRYRKRYLSGLKQDV